MNSRILRKITRIRSIISLVVTARDVLIIEYTYLIKILNNQNNIIIRSLIIKSPIINR